MTFNTCHRHEVVPQNRTTILFPERIYDLSTRNVRVIPRWSVANAIGAALAQTACEVSLFAGTHG